MVDVNSTPLPKEIRKIYHRGKKNHSDQRIETWINYRDLILDLNMHKADLIEPPSKDLSTQLDQCNVLFKDVRTPREGVLDAVALKTISSFARIQTRAIGQRATTEDAFKLIRQCATLIRTNPTDSDDVFADFYLNFCHCHKRTSTMNFMSGRLPTLWFEKRIVEKSFVKERFRRTKDIIDASQHTKIVEIKKMSTNGEQTSKEIIRIHRCLEDSYQANHEQPISFFLFTIHPTLFSRSVENIFHVSFLIREGKVELFLDENQLPVLRPVNKSSASDGDVSSSTPNKTEQMQSLTQLILSLDMEQWETLVQVFDIQTAMIQH